MKFKKISRDDLIDKATKIINKPSIAVNNLFYESREWKSIQNSYIKENPLCELCLNEGNKNKSAHVHHIMPLSQGGEPFSEENLIALYKPCHGSIHASSGIAVEFDINFFGPDPLNNFTTHLENINVNLLSQCKVGDAINLIRERKPDDINYVGALNKSGEYLGVINPTVIRKYYLAFDIDHGAEVSAYIKQIIYESGKTECIIEITKGDVDDEEYYSRFVEDEKAKHIIFKAKTLEKNDTEKSLC